MNRVSHLLAVFVSTLSLSLRGTSPPPLLPIHNDRRYRKEQQDGRSNMLFSQRDFLTKMIEMIFSQRDFLTKMITMIGSRRLRKVLPSLFIAQPPEAIVGSFFI